MICQDRASSSWVLTLEDGYDKIWQRDDGDEIGPFYVFENFKDDE